MNYEVIKPSSPTIYIVKVINTDNDKLIKEVELDVSKNNDAYIMYTIYKSDGQSIVEVDGIKYEVKGWIIEGNHIKIFVWTSRKDNMNKYQCKINVL